VGVVGRTGSGKSTLLLALYRMFNLESGAVVVDGVDVSGLTLEQLRRGLSVIPQEPVVFSGTVRSNLDPFGEFGHDAVLWEAIRDSGLEEQVGAGAGDGMAVVAGWLDGRCVCSQLSGARMLPFLCWAHEPAADPLVPALSSPPLPSLHPCRSRCAAAWMPAWTAPAARPGPWASSS
jgi:hypothetical protein